MVFSSSRSEEKAPITGKTWTSEKNLITLPEAFTRRICVRKTICISNFLEVTEQQLFAGLLDNVQQGGD